MARTQSDPTDGASETGPGIFDLREISPDGSGHPEYSPPDRPPSRGQGHAQTPRPGRGTSSGASAR